VKEEVVAAPPVKGEPIVKSEVPLKVALDKIYFAFDSDVLTDQSREALYKDAETIIKKTTGKYTLEGHCDERGSDEYNMALGEKRAKAVQKYLLTLGVAPERLSTISFGEEKPAEPGHDEGAWAKNRRVEFNHQH
jgi:peptidoglycan-associated lipoprotein